MIDSIVSLAGRMVSSKGRRPFCYRAVLGRINGESPHGFYWWIGEGRYLSTWVHLLCRIFDGKYARVLCVMSCTPQI